MDKNKNALHIVLIAEYISTNYGEGTGNNNVIKKFTRGDGKEYSFISPQSISYWLKETAGFANTPVRASGDRKGVIQYALETTIRDYPEIDIMGYLKTRDKNNNSEKENDDNSKNNENNIKGSRYRKKVARINPMISLEPYTGDIDYQTNLSLAQRGGYYCDIIQTEMHYTYGVYSISIDLDRLGIDKEDNIEIPNEEKYKRVEAILDAAQFLYADTKGRRENLAPIFAIGGVYDRKNPFFQNRVKFSHKCNLNLEMIKDTIENSGFQEDTMVGYLKSSLPNDEEIIKELQPVSIRVFFDELKKKVKEYYLG